MIKKASEGFIFVRRFVGSSNGHFGNEPANLQGHKISLMIGYLLIIKLNLAFDLQARMFMFLNKNIDNVGCRLVFNCPP